MCFSPGTGAAAVIACVCVCVFRLLPNGQAARVTVVSGQHGTAAARAIRPVLGQVRETRGALTFRPRRFLLLLFTSRSACGFIIISFARRRARDLRRAARACFYGFTTENPVSARVLYHILSLSLSLSHPPPHTHSRVFSEVLNECCVRSNPDC